MRQELGHALYQHDAACRVIARLIKERDDARAALSEACPGTIAYVPPVRQSGATAPPAPTFVQVPSTSNMDGASLSDDVLVEMDTTAKALQKGRKKRLFQDGCATPQQLSKYTLRTSQLLQPAGVVRMDVHASSPFIATGGTDGALVLSEYSSGSVTVLSRIRAHEQAVTSVKLHPSRCAARARAPSLHLLSPNYVSPNSCSSIARPPGLAAATHLTVNSGTYPRPRVLLRALRSPLVISTATDGTARVFNRSSCALAVELRAHTAAITACSLHATGAYVATASADHSWAFHELERGICLLRHQDTSAPAYTCAGFHPDGLIFATGLGHIVRVWDMKSRAILTTFEGHSQPLTCLAFSENGYYLATGAADATVKLWDLRKLQSFHTIEPDSASMAVSDVAFDHSGQVLAVARGSVSLFETKAWATLAVHEEHPAPASAVGFGQCAAFFASASEDGVLRLYGSH